MLRHTIHIIRRDVNKKNNTDADLFKKKSVKINVTIEFNKVKHLNRLN